MKGAVAAGSQATVDAGVWALRQGGNAVDAAVAATLMAGVAEPLLTGLAGAGLATVRFEGEVYCFDFFANMPGLDSPASDHAEMDEVRINFGPTTQRFFVGLGSAAVPGVPCGLWEMQGRFGRMAMSDLVTPASEAARNGVPVTEGFARVCELLWPILERTDSVRGLFSVDGRPLRSGDTFRCAALSETLTRFGRSADFFEDGEGARALLEKLGPQSRMTASDLTAQRCRVRKALGIRYRDATLWVPGSPSAAGVGIANTLASLEAAKVPSAATGTESVYTMVDALRSTEGLRGEPFLRDLFSDGFDRAFVERLQSQKPSGERVTPGYTTHISTVDSEGNAVSTTHSLGETAGEMAGETGVLINNFLGEGDVNPPYFRRPAGSRLVTMCCPSILERSDGQVVALGSGGSSRIPTAVVHGARYLIEHDASIRDAVEGPRTHVENGVVHVESDGRSDATMAQVVQAIPDMVRFDGPNMYFGGLHVAAWGPSGFDGQGDARRSGAFKAT